MAIAIAAAILAAPVAADAAGKGKNTAMAQREASCKAQAAKKFSVVRFMARRDYVNKCMGHAAQAKAKKPRMQNKAKSS
jgi:hypothetical protein